MCGAVAHLGEKRLPGGTRTLLLERRRLRRPSDPVSASRVLSRRSQPADGRRTACRDQVGTSGTSRAATVPSNLILSERAAFEICLTDNLRIEQEHLPQSFVLEMFLYLKESAADLM